jgi:hypothetical protein
MPSSISTLPGHDRPRVQQVSKAGRRWSHNFRQYDSALSILSYLFTPDGALRMPNIPVELEGREQIRAWGERVPDLVDSLVQTTHPGTIQRLRPGQVAAPEPGSRRGGGSAGPSL